MRLRINARSLPVLLGGILVALSLYPAFLIAQESVLSKRAYSRYEVSRLPMSETAIIGGKPVEVIESRQRKGHLEILVNDQEFHINALDPDGTNEFGRSFSEMAFVRMLDREAGEEFLVLIQGAGGVPSESWVYEAYFISPKGLNRAERFSYSELSDRLYRPVLARFAGPPVGFKSMAASVVPIWVYPVVYPTLSFAIGLCLGLWGIFRGRAGD